MNEPPPLKQELDRALTECGYAIMAWNMLPSGIEEAEAEVELIDEGAAKVLIRLSLRGYECDQPVAHAETLDDLLKAISPGFAHRSHLLLSSKLEDLARARWQ